jgi:hypothetical protein
MIQSSLKKSHFSVRDSKVFFFQEPATTVTLFSIKIEQRRLTNLLHEAQTPTHTHQLLLLPPTCLAIFQFSSSAFVACISCVMLELFLSNVLAFLSSNSCSCLQLLERSPPCFCSLAGLNQWSTTNLVQFPALLKQYLQLHVLDIS